MSQKERQKKLEELNKLVEIKLIIVGYNKTELAALLGIGLLTFYRKLAGENKFTLNEIQDLARRLEFSNEELLKIF